MVEILLRSQKNGLDGNNRNIWKTTETRENLIPSDTALLLCDAWDSHWCRGAVERLDGMTFRMNDTVEASRAAGITIVHAPSGTLEVYKDTKARKRILEVERTEPTEREHIDPPLPIDASDNGSSTGETETCQAWTSQHPAIRIDQEKDVISDSGEEIFSYFTDRGIRTMLILGVHTNMCVLHRSFGIKQMVRWGVRPILIRDLTDTMYNPEMPPYVSQEASTDLVIIYIEKFWCGTTTSVHFADS